MSNSRIQVCLDELTLIDETSLSKEQWMSYKNDLFTLQRELAQTISLLEAQTINDHASMLNEIIEALDYCSIEIESEVFSDDYVSSLLNIEEEQE